MAIDLYRRGIISIGRAAEFAGIPLAEFRALCGTLQIPVLHEPPGGLEAELAGLEAALSGQRPTAGYSNALPDIAPVPRDEHEATDLSAHEPSQG